MIYFLISYTATQFKKTLFDLLFIFGRPAGFYEDICYDLSIKYVDVI